MLTQLLVCDLRFPTSLHQLSFQQFLISFWCILVGVEKLVRSKGARFMIFCGLYSSFIVTTYSGMETSFHHCVGEVVGGVEWSMKGFLKK
jgi:hypothetical protein